MKIKNISLFLLINLLVCFNSSGVSAFDITDRYVDPATMGRESIDSFRPNTYDSAAEDSMSRKDKLKMNQSSNVAKYNLDATKTVGPKSFLLNKIVITGNTKLSERRLRKFTSKLEGQKVTIQDLKILCDEITNYYQKKGYITTRAKILTQKVDDGTVELTVDEGKYGDIQITGNKWAKEKYLNNILAVNGVKKDEVLNVHNLENAITEINNKRYIKGNVIINNGKKADLNDIHLDVKDRVPVDLSADWNNYGTELMGMQRAFLKLSYDNLTGYGDSLYGGAILGSNNIGTIAGYNVPVGNKGTMLNMGLSTYNVNYGGPYRDLGLYGNWRNYSIGLTHPLIRKGQWLVDSSVMFDICDVNQGSSAISNGYLSSQKLRVLRSGISARKNDSKGFWTSNAIVSTGLPIWEATSADRNGGGPDGNFIKVNAGINRLQVLPKRSMFLFSLNGQYAPNQLLSPEKLALGGINGRGYETASALGDSGVFGTLEFRTPVPFLKKILPESWKPYEDKIKMGYFYDFGVLYDSSGYSKLLTGKDTNLLQSVGVGLHFPIGNLLMVNLDLGMPIGEKAFINQGARLTFSVSSSLQNVWNWKKIEKQTL